MKKIITLLFVIFSLTSAAQTDSTLFMLNECGVDTTLIPHGFKVDSIKKLKEGTLKVFLSEIKVFGQKQRRKVLIYTGTKDAVDVNLEIDGLLIDETKTKSGRDFYEYFYKDWTAPIGAKNYTIYITEKPYRLNNTIIEIKINETLVFQQFLQRRDELVEEMAHNAARQVQQYLLQYEEITKQLGGADMVGDGI